MKSKSTAYLLWLFLGLIGAHRFYLEKVGTGILYFFTGGIFGIGWLIDLFTLGEQVDSYNLLYLAQRKAADSGLGFAPQNPNQPRYVTARQAVSRPQRPQTQHPPISGTAEQKIMALSTRKAQLSIREIMIYTELSLDEVESTLTRFVQKGIVQEVVDTNGKILYEFL